MKKHAQQVAAWGKLLGLCNTLGDSYKPSKDSMKGTALENLLHESENQVTAVHKAEAVLANAISERQQAFHQLPFIGTRVVNALEALGPPLEHLNNVNRIRKRFRTQALYTSRGTAQESSPGGQAGQTNGGTENSSETVSRKRAQGDLNSKIDNMQLLINHLENGPPYATSEDDITIEGLKQFLVALRQKNETVLQAQRELQQTKLKRDEMLYGKNGMHNIARMVKRYVHSVYGFKSPQFKTISKIKFKK